MRKISKIVKLVTVSSALAVALTGTFQIASAGSGAPAPKAACKAGKIVRTDGSGAPAPKAACKAGKIVRTDGSGAPAPK